MELQSLITRQIEEILGPQGMAVADGLAFNPSQLDFAKRTLAGFFRYQNGAAAINSLQASTGLGKTLGYCVPAMLYAAHTKERVAISTFTRSLQQQILHGDGKRATEWVRRLTGKQLSIARRVGLNSYVSIERCMTLIQKYAAANDKREAVEFLNLLIDWAEAARDGEVVNSGVLDDFLCELGMTGLPDCLSQRMLCFGRLEDAEAAHYVRDVESSKLADVVVVNHSLLAINAYRYATILDSGRPISVLIADEADRLTVAAESIALEEVSISGLSQFLHDASRELNLSDLIGAANGLGDYLRSLKPGGKNLIEAPPGRDLHHLISGVLEAMTPVALQLAQREALGGWLFGEDTKYSEIAGRILEYFQRLKKYRDGLGGNTPTVSMISWTPVRENPSLRVASPFPGRIFSRYWSDLNWDCDLGSRRSYVKAVLFCSATLATPGRPIEQSFDSFFSEVGVIRHPKRGEVVPIHNVTVDLFAHFQPISKFGEMRFVLADPRVPGPSRAGAEHEETVEYEPEWLNYAASMIRAAWGSGGRTLCLLPSFDLTRALADLLADTPDLIVHARGEKLATILPRYRAAARALLLTPGGWEGLDLPGLIQNLVIPRLPFSRPDTARNDAMRLYLAKRNYDPIEIGNVLQANATLEARRQLAQGIGRAIRKHDDNCRIWIADPRFPCFIDDLDPIKLEAVTRRTYPGMIEAIPNRFRPALETADVWLKECGFYSQNEEMVV